MKYFTRLSSLLIILLISGRVALAQKTIEPKAPVQFGEVTKADFLPSRDSAAAAEILCDYGQSGIVGAREKFQVVFERVTRIHILRKSGYDWATVRVPLYVKDENKEKLSNLKGFTYNLIDGKVEKTKLDVNTGAFSEKVDKNHVLYSFTMPNVREGAIVEFSYLIKSDFLFNLQDWQFQHDIPVRWSEYRVTLPSFFRYKQITRGYLPFAVQDQQMVAYHTTYQQDQQSGYGSVASAPSSNAFLTTQALQGRWVLQDAPAFREEPYMTTARDYLRSVHFELAGSDFSSSGNEYHDVSGTWETITKRLLANEQFGGALQQNTPLLAVAQTLRTVPDPRQRAAAVLHLVQQAVHYNGEETFYATQSLRKVCEQHRGNAAEVNLLLLQALRAADLEANPLLLSTRRHGQIVTDLPLLTQFNYVIAHVALPDNPDLLLDATEPLAPLGVLPERCLNGQGRLLTSAGRWLPLLPGRSYLHYTNAQLTLTDAGALQSQAHLEYGGYAALEVRQQVLDQGESAYKTQLGRRWVDWQLTTPARLAPAQGARQALRCGPGPDATRRRRAPGHALPAADAGVRPQHQSVPARRPLLPGGLGHGPRVPANRDAAAARQLHPAGKARRPSPGPARQRRTVHLPRGAVGLRHVADYGPPATHQDHFLPRAIHCPARILQPRPGQVRGDAGAAKEVGTWIAARHFDQREKSRVLL